MRMPDFGITMSTEPLYVFGIVPYLRYARFMVSAKRETGKQLVIFIRVQAARKRKNRCRGSL